MRTRTLSLILLSAALVLAGCAGTDTSASGPTDGIGVHGAWSIDVHDPDGTVAASTQFSNALIGADVLTDILTASLALSTSLTGGEADWLLRATTDDCGTGGEDDYFTRVGDGAPGNDAAVTDNGASFTIEGSVEAECDAEVTAVQTELWLNGDSGLGDYPITRKDLADPVAIAEGQIVQIEVEISFGTLPAPTS